MVRLLDASIALNTWAGALNMFTLWIVSASIAGLIFALCARQPRQRLIAGNGLASALVSPGPAEVTVACALVPANWTQRRDQTAMSRAE